MRSIGVDLGKKPTICVVAEGKVVQRRTLRDLDELSLVLGPETGERARVAIEACREAWLVADWLEGWGHEVLLVDTTRAKQMGIGQHGRKTDRIDAETLARAVEEDRVPRAHLLSPSRRKLRTELNMRRVLVGARANCVTTVRGIARMSGVRLPGCEVEQFAEHLERAELPAELREGIDPLVHVLRELETRIAQVDERLEKLSATEPAHQLLKTAPGAGPIVSAMFISVIDDPSRFKTAHQVEAYLGLVPSEKTSGKRKLGSITKQGNSYLRALLVQGAWSILRTRGADPLKLWGLEILRRRGKRIAVIALARRLAGILWAMWRRDTVYEPARLSEASAEGFEQQAQAAQVRAWALKRAAGKRLRPAARSTR
jgi:transposase